MSLLSDLAHNLHLDDHQTVKVELAARSYPIHIGSGLIDKAHTYVRETLGAPRCMIVTDSNVGPLYAGKLFQNLQRAGMAKDDPLVLPAGEQTKNFSHLSHVLDWLFQRDIDRKTVLIALGGGVIGDLVGLAASLALRGIDFVQIPTTLLAQVDSSVGGKTAINSPRGKNLIGAFHQPRLVLADVDALKTLPQREQKAGYAEIVKYGLLGNLEFFNWLDDKGKNLLQDRAEMKIKAIATSIGMKAAIVAKDEKETGVRTLLNLGHTFAHAFEAASNFNGSVLHGEAVALGMVKAFQLSESLGHCQPADTRRVIAHIENAGLPISIKGRGWKTEQLMAIMYKDKKAEGGQLTFVLVRGIGEAFVEKHVEATHVRAVLDNAE
jgi:3-dehydroquinate synthase